MGSVCVCVCASVCVCTQRDKSGEENPKKSIKILPEIASMVLVPQRTGSLTHTGSNSTAQILFLVSFPSLPCLPCILHLTRSHCVVSVDLELSSVLPPQPPESWDKRHIYHHIVPASRPFWKSLDSVRFLCVWSQRCIQWMIKWY